MTIPDSKPLNLRDTIYCTSVSLTAIAMVLCGVLRRMIGGVGVLDYLTSLLDAVEVDESDRPKRSSSRYSFRR